MAEIASVSTKEKGCVLIVDDVEVNRFVLSNIIKSMGYTPATAENGRVALDMIRESAPELILLDVAMPEMDGFELTGILKADVTTRDIPIIFISAFDETADMVKGFKLGGQDYVVKPFVPEVVKARVGVHLQFNNTRKELQASNKRLQASLSNQLRQIEEEKKGVLYALANLARTNSMYGDEYLERLQYNCKILAQALQIAEVYPEIISDSYIENLEVAAPLMDIGNVAVAKVILQKDTELSQEDRAYIENHTTVGSKLLRDIALQKDYKDFVDMAADIAGCHHENWDGSGYPARLKGEEIPLSAQIVSVVSIFCALTSDRVYREALPRERAIEIMEEIHEARFNPMIYSVYKMIINQLK